MLFIYRILFLYVLFIFLSCSPSPDIELTGRIGKKVEGKMLLDILENNVSGNFVNTETNQKIPLRGTLFKENLRIEEFANENELTGVFDGKFDGVTYKGNWISPDKKIKVPFEFEIKEPLKNDGNKIVIDEYKKWARKQNENNPELCNQKECEESFKKSQEIGNLNYGCEYKWREEVSSKNIFLEDFNNDGIQDAILNTGYEACIEDVYGALRSIVSGTTIISLISSGNRYIIDSSPNVIQENLGGLYGFIERVDNGIVIAKGRANSGDPDVLYWELDLEWDAKFKYDDGEFKLVEKSKVRNIFE